MRGAYEQNGHIHIISRHTFIQEEVDLDQKRPLST